MGSDKYKQALPLMNLGASRPPNSGDTFASGFSTGSVWTYLSDTYNCTGDGIWELISNIPPLNDVLSVGNDAGTEQIKNLGDATDPQDAMTYGQFLNGLAGLTSYFFSSTNSDISGYESMPDLANYTSSTEANNGGVSVSTTPTSLGKFATNSGFPNVTKIPIGLFTAHFEVQKSAGSNNFASLFRLYKRDLSGTETLLLESDRSSEISSNTRQQISVSGYISSPITLLATDRIVIEPLSVMNASTATITMYYDGTTNARFAMPVVSAESGGGTTWHLNNVVALLGASGSDGSLTSATAIDRIPTTSQAIGTVVACTISSRVYFYKLTSGTTVESSPRIIRPNDYATTTNEKVWVFTDPYALYEEKISFVSGNVQAINYYKNAVTIIEVIKSTAISTVTYSVNGGSYLNALGGTFTIASGSEVVWQITYVSPTITSQGQVWLNGYDS